MPLRVLILLVAALLSPSLAGAVCLDPRTDISGYHVPLDEEIRESTAIAVGTVVGEKKLNDGPDGPEWIVATISTVRIQKVLKGHLPEQVNVRTENDSGRYSMDIGEAHLLFLRPLPPNLGAGYWADSCGSSSRLPKGDAVVKQVEARLSKWAADDDILKARGEAEALGRAMFESEEHPGTFDPADIEAAARRVSGWCEFSYKAILVTHSGARLVYFIAQPRPGESVVLGRHFRVGPTTAEPSTRVCLALTPPGSGKEPVAIATSHLLSATPNEFHVYLSLRYRQPVYVVINREMWLVEDGKIRKLP
jgi:hypothetical protein